LNKCVVEFYTTNVEKDTVKRIKFIHFFTEIIKQIRKVEKKEKAQETEMVTGKSFKAMFIEKL
jgi:hypothetical protein